MSPDEFYLNGGINNITLKKKTVKRKVGKVGKRKVGKVGKRKVGKRKSVKVGKSNIVKKLAKRYNLSVLKARKILKSIKTKNKTKKMKLFRKKVCSFGKKKNRWIQSVTKTFAKKGTKGAFTRWCKRKGFNGVTDRCIKLGKRDRSLRTRRRAVFAENIRR